MRTDENLCNYINYTCDSKDGKIVWEKSTIIEKAFFVRVAEEKNPNFGFSVTVFIDMMTYPEWDNIDDEDQKILTNAIMESLNL